MSGRAFVTVQKAFAAAAGSAFGFLAAEFGLSGPEFHETVLPVVAFTGRGLRYRIMLDSADRIVMTRIELDAGAKSLVAELPNLVEAAGLGARNHVAQSVPTLNTLNQVLESQARYVRLLQSKLGSENAVELMRAANARQWRVG